MTSTTETTMQKQSEALGTEATVRVEAGKPKLVFVYGRTDGQSRRVEAFIAQVLQRRHNHETFELIRVCADEQPELVERLGVSDVPTLLVVDKRKVGLRLKRPKGAREPVAPSHVPRAPRTAARAR
jgi:thioredoxin-like negative regulator of GroEL